MSDYLLSGAVTNALNMASISAEEAPRLQPFAALIDKLGTFAGQIADDGLEAVEIEYEGEVAQSQYATADRDCVGRADAASDARREHGVRARRAQAEGHPAHRVQARDSRRSTAR